jgi:hypothetical protein
MVQLQTVSGFFENAAEAQQAVQLLLGGGVTSDTIQLSTQPDPGTRRNETLPAPAKADRSSGRFFSSLFGNQEAYRSERTGTGVKANRRPRLSWPGSRCLTVQTRSADEVKRVTALLKRAGAGEVTLRNRSAPGEFHE